MAEPSAPAVGRSGPGALVLAACALWITAGCGRPADAGAAASPRAPSAASPGAISPDVAASAVAGSGAATTIHEGFAAKGITCAACHPCGAAARHPLAWMDPGAGGFHAVSANAGLSSCQGCHGTNLDGVGGSTAIGCAQCHGASWKTDCTMCHGGAESMTGAPPRATWGNGADAVRAGAHGAHVGAGHALSKPIDCGVCHPKPADAFAAGHLDASPAEVAFSGLAAQAVTAAPTWTRSSATCAGTYCHGATLRSAASGAPGLNLTPSWTGGPAEAACGSCHTLPPPQPHPHTQLCQDCHPGYTLNSVDVATHIDGVVQAENLTCSSCHGDDTRVLVSGADGLALAAPPYGTRGETQTTSRAVGAHQAHVNRGDGMALPAACDTCHLVPTTYDHADGSTVLQFGALATMDGATPSFDGAACSNTYCHGSTLNHGGTSHTPTWTASGPLACDTCHGAPPPDPHPQDTDCIRCHPGYTATSARRTTHVNGISDFPSACNACHDDPPSSGEHYRHTQHRIGCDRCHEGYTRTSANPTLHRNARQDVTVNGWDPVRRTCSSANGCHGSEYWGRTTIAQQTGCNRCHGVPPDSGEHLEHREYSCSRCHGTGYSSTTVNAATHMSGTVDMLSWYDRSTLTCGRACHDGKRWGSRGQVTANCNACHGFPPVPPHPQRTSCHDCHPSMNADGTLTATHNDGQVDVSGQGCASCHGYPPVTTRTGAFHTTDQNCHGCHSTTVDASNNVVPNGTHNDGAVQVGGGGVGTYGCQTCHGDQARQVPPGVDPQVKSAPPVGTRGETRESERAVGAHQAHLARIAGLAKPLVCGECHPVPATMGHANGSTVFDFGPLARASGAAPTFDGSTLSCTSTYCHGATLGAGGTNRAPIWIGGSGQAACGTCHASPPPAPHTAKTTCGGCHAGYTAATVNTATHVDGKLDVSSQACGSCHGIPPPAPHTASTACGQCHPGYTSTSVDEAMHIDGTVQVANLTCSSCHGKVGGSATAAAPLDAAPPVDTLGASAGLRVGAHTKHLAGGAYSNALPCQTCHAGLATYAVGHSNGANDVAFTGAANANLRKGTWRPRSGTTPGSCASTWCHGAVINRSGGTSGGTATAPTWTATLTTCTACHAVTGSSLPDGHTRSEHRKACSICHGPGYTSTATTSPTGNGVNKPTHVDGVKTIVTTQSGTGIRSWNPTTRSCAPSCHGSETW